MSLEITEEDTIQIPVKGHVFVNIEYADGKTEQIDLGRNFVAFEARLLIAQLMKFNFDNGDKIVNGVSHLAVGTGGPYQVGTEIKPFDIHNPPVPGVDIYNENKPGSFDKNGDGLSDLINEVSRKPVATFYVDGAGRQTNQRTTTVDFTATFDFNEANGPLVEMAIFGGDNASQSGRGTMVAVKMFPVVTKTGAMRMTFTWRLSF